MGSQPSINVNKQIQHEQINIRVVLVFDKCNASFEILVDQVAPVKQFFSELKNKVKELRFELDQEKQKEYRLENGKSISPYDSKSLQILGFFQNCTFYVTKTFKEIPFILKIESILPKNWDYDLQSEFNFSIYPQTSFCFIIDRIKDELNLEKQHLEKLEFYLNRDQKIENGEKKWALEFNIKNSSVLLITIPINIDIIYYEWSHFNGNIQILLSSSFNHFVEKVKALIKKNLEFQSGDTIYFMLDKKFFINKNETRSLSQLEFTENSIVFVKWYQDWEHFYQ